MNLAQNDKLRENISKRVGEIFETRANLIKDAGERGMPIDATRLSKYFKGKSGGLTDEQVLWVATRVGIEIHLNFGTPVVENGKLKFQIESYDELMVLKRLKKIFGR